MTALGVQPAMRPEESAEVARRGQNVEFISMQSAGLERISTSKSSGKMKVNNTVVATPCASFSSRPEVSANATSKPFEPGECGAGEHGDDDGVRVRLAFTVNFMIHLGTYVNGVYHPKGTCNGRRLFCRNLGGGGCPHLFLYYLPDRDSWAVGLYPGDGEVYAVCGPAEDQSLAQPWHVWDGKAWIENPPTVASVVYKSDQQTARWEDQATCHNKTAGAKKAHHQIRQKLYDYAVRGGFRPLLEKGGILQEHVILVRTRLAAEVNPGAFKEETNRRLAWDVKVIDHELDIDRYSAKDHSPLGVADACRQFSMAYNRQEQRCVEERPGGWKYEPLVFTLQGHVAPEAEAVIFLIAAAVARVERKDEEAVRGELLRTLNASLP